MGICSCMQFTNERGRWEQGYHSIELSLRSFNQREVIYLSESTDVIKDSVTLSASDENLEHTPHTKDIEIVVAQKNESQTGNSFDSLDEIIGSGLIKESAGKMVQGKIIIIWFGILKVGFVISIYPR